MNLFEFGNGGIYRIVCTKNNKIYYGQTSCFIRRCFQHLQFFEKHTHSCLELQKDVDKYGIKVFLFEVIQVENKLKKRLKLEKKLIDNTPLDLLYNPKKDIHNFRKAPRIAQRVKIHDQQYYSIAEASRCLNKSSRNIRMKLDDPSNNHYERLDYHRHSYFDEYEVMIDDQYFKSTRDVVNIGLAKTTRQVRDRCRSHKWQTWLLVKKGLTNIPDRE